MDPYTSEDLMWERLKDIQREVENSRLLARSRPRRFRPGRWIVGLLTRRASVEPLEIEDRPATSDVA